MAFFSGNIRSEILGMDTGLNVVLPYDRPTEKQASPCKVVYLLHGLGENYSAWIRNTNVERYARDYGVALIMPEVQKSFYTDMFFGTNYFEYITTELPKICKSMFNISDKREDTFIAGLSMGGYGALKAALTHPELYKGCGSFSALTDVRFIQGEAEGLGQTNEVIGVYGPELIVLPENNLAKLAKARMEDGKENLPDFYITCGKQDYLYLLNKKYIDYLTKISFPHTFEEWDGEHEWDFWDISVKKAFERFFGNYD